MAMALEGGADRVELCMALSAEGVTPSAGCMARSIEAAKGMPVTVLIRSREGDFRYSRSDIDAMVLDIKTAREKGAAGVTIGALTAGGDIDTVAMKRLIDAAKPGLEVTFHRAMDVCRHPAEALEQLIGLGCDRVLTSGQARSCLEGLDRLAALVAQAAGRIEIMPGGGVRPDNIAQLQKATGARQFHSSARRKAAISAGKPLFGIRPQAVDSDIVKALKENTI